MNRKTIFPCLAALTGWLPAMAVSADRIEPLPYAVPARLPDAAEALSPSAVHLDGWLGHRVEINAKNRLLTVDTEPLLAGFRKKPGVPSLDRRARRQVDARRHAGLGLYGRPRPARETRPRGRRPDPLAGARRLPRHLRARTTLRAVQRRRLGRLVAQVQSHRPAHLLPVHGQRGGAGGLPQDGRSA